MHTTPQEKYLLETDKPGSVTGSKLRVSCLVFFFLAVACSYLQWFVHNCRLFKLEDSGLFLYIGQRLIHGDLLYRVIADNKPPFIYWLNALGLLLGHGSPGGVLILCLAAGILTFAILYWGVRQHVGWQLFIIAGCWSQLAFLACCVHPNYTETFSLPLVALAAVLFVRELLSAERVAWYAVAQGVIAALLFCLRPNNTGIAIIYLLYLLLGLRNRSGFRQLCFFVLAGAVVYGLVLVSLAVQGILPDYFTNVFRLAGPYTGGTKIIARFHSFWHGVHLFSASPLLYFSFACGVTAILSHRHHRYNSVLFWLAAWLLLEMALSSMSGYIWDHYYLLWIVPLALIVMLAGSVLFSRGLHPILPVILAVSLVLVVFEEAAIDAYRAWSNPLPEDSVLALARTYVRKGDRVTTWGHFYHDLWFDLGHPSGTRWFHEGAYTNRSIYRALMPMFLSDLEKNLPRVVIERRSMVPLFAPANPKEPLNDAFQPAYFQGWDDASITKRKAALAKHYCPATEQSGVVVYLRCR